MLLTSIYRQTNRIGTGFTCVSAKQLQYHCVCNSDVKLKITHPFVQIAFYFIRDVDLLLRFWKLQRRLVVSYVNKLPETKDVQLF